MDYIGMTNEEIISMFEERLNTNKVVRVEDLKAVLATRSIVDYKASADAIAIFYSGESVPV